MSDGLGLSRPAGSTPGEWRDRPAGPPGWMGLMMPAWVRDGDATFGAWQETTSADRVVTSAWALADTLTARGRHADAGRALQAAAASARRRGDALGCGALWLALGRLWRLRGQVAEAEGVIRQARHAFDQGQLARGAIVCLLDLSCLAWDDDRFHDSADRVREAILAAAQAGDVVALSAARWTSAHLACWDGRIEEARAWMHECDRHVWPARLPAVRDSCPATAVSEGRRVHEWLLPRSRTAALALVVRARAAASPGAWPSGYCPADDQASGPGLDRVVGRTAEREASILESASRGDWEGVRAGLDAGVQEARRHHLPLLALSLRLTAGECAGAMRVEAGGAWHRWSRVPLPGLYRRRLRELCGAVQPEAASVARRVVRSASLTAADLLSLIRTVNDAADERTALDRGCEYVRRRLEASAVSVFVTGTPEAVVLAHAGGRGCDAGAALRAIRRGRTDEIGTDLAGQTFAAVSWAGEGIGVVGARWPRDGQVDAASATELLSTLASVCASSVRALRDSREATAVTTVATSDILGSSQTVAELRRLVARAGATPFPVLIQGESGTGKELLARAIHRASERRSRRFCAVNCAALNEDLLEAELFGHSRGAFTGAAADRPGLFEEADGGTLFLDEIGELSPRGQAKVLRAIQEHEVRRVGENHHRRVDVRIVTATNRTLADEVLRGRFRQDLYYRLDVVRIDVPPLRSRPEDIPLLAERFWKDTMAQTGGRSMLTADALAVLARRPWPGNVRELQNTLAALAVRVPGHGRVGARDLAWLTPDAPAPGTTVPTLDAARREFEARFVREALARAGGRRSRAAAALGVTRQGLAKLVTRLGIERDTEPGSGDRVAGPAD